jgi:hypothetical protein
MSERRLAQVCVDMQVKRPGLWDGRFVNPQGEHYSEARHGLNPLEQGFCICAPVRTGRDLRCVSEMKRCLPVDKT